jgi:hypothetical protein
VSVAAVAALLTVIGILLYKKKCKDRYSIDAEKKDPVIDENDDSKDLKLKGNIEGSEMNSKNSLHAVPPEQTMMTQVPPEQTMMTQ